MTTVSPIGTWHADLEAETAMGLGHAPMWRHLIDLVPERDLQMKSVLDYGCNQGGFLRTLYAIRPFRRGLGLDVASQSIERARALKGDLPVQYELVNESSSWQNEIDIAFSYEVLYLLPDLREHAQRIEGMLRPGGIYYAVIGCYTGNPLWPHWRQFIPNRTNLAVQDYSLDDYAAAFRTVGMKVSARRFRFDGFIELKADNDHYRSIDEALDYFTTTKVLFRFTKPL